MEGVERENLWTQEADPVQETPASWFGSRSATLIAGSQVLITCSPEIYILSAKPRIPQKTQEARGMSLETPPTSQGFFCPSSSPPHFQQN